MKVVISSFKIGVEMQKLWKVKVYINFLFKWTHETLLIVVTITILSM